jgi:F-type H+-transporting ATPase subunit b
MEQLIHAFGIDVKLIVVQIINFVILMGTLSYFLYKPVLKVLADREEKVAQGIKDAEAAAAAKADAEKQKQYILTAAHTEADKVAQNAKAFADEKSVSILADAQDKAASVIKDAETKGEEIKTQARRESEAEIAKIAILAAEKVLREKSS